MRWQDFRRSDNIEEGSAGGSGGYGFGMPVRLSGGVIVIAVIVGLLFGVNPLDMLSALMGGGGTVVQAPAPAPAPPSSSQSTQRAGAVDTRRDFVAAIVGSTEDVWGKIFQDQGSHYDPPKLHLFHGSERSACGFASAGSSGSCAVSCWPIPPPWRWAESRSSTAAPSWDA